MPETVLQPVYNYGDTDSGPRKALDGNSGEEATAKADEPEPAAGEPAAVPEVLSAGPGGDAPAVAGGAAAAEKAAKKAAAKAAEEDKKLFSRTENGAPVATTAEDGVPRGVRAGRLCVTVLRDQLRDGLPPYYPDLLPAYRLESGTVLDIPKAAFRVGRQWYDLSYRCEVDEKATRVVGFSYKVGRPLPPSEWKRRGLPAR